MTNRLPIRAYWRSSASPTLFLVCLRRLELISVPAYNAACRVTSYR
jgi:hypothetical protein